MHEQSIVESLLSVVLKSAEQNQAERIVAINLVVGDLSGVVEDAVNFYFNFLARETIAAGATHMPLLPFLIISSLGRAGRFFLVASLLRLFGPAMRRTIEKHFDLAAVLFLVLLVGGFLAVKLL